MEANPYNRAFAVIHHLSKYVGKLDVLYYDRAYETEGGSSFDKLREGLDNFFYKPKVQIKADGNVTFYGIRRLPIDGILSTWLQDSWVYYQFRKICKTKYVLCISEQPGPAMIARKLKRRDLAKYYIYNDVDYFPAFASGLRSLAIARQEKKGIDSSDLVACVSTKLNELRVKQGAKNVCTITNGVDLKLFSSIAKNISHPPTLLYSGSLEEWAGVHIVLNAIPDISKKIQDIRFWIIGDGSFTGKCKEIVTKNKIEHIVTFLGKKSPEDLPEYFSQADIGLLPSIPSKLRYYASPLKLFQYMAAGLPVISTDIGELSTIIQKYQVGVAIPFDSSAYAKAIIELLENPSLRDTFAKNGTGAAIHFNWQVLLDNYWKKILEIMDAHRD